MKALATTLGILLLAGVLGACAQFTTSDAEEQRLIGAAESRANDYLACLRREALLYVDSSRDSSFVSDAAQSRCATELEAFERAETEYQKTQTMVTTKPVEKSVDALRERGRILIAEEMLRGAPAADSAARPRTAAPAPAAAPPASSPTGRTDWTAEQRVYLDCMADQANRYAGLNESADVVAEVAQSRCRTYLTGSDTAALAQEGRALVLGTVLDARLDPRRR